MKRKLLGSVFCLLLLLLASCQSTPILFSGATMGTTYSINIAAKIPSPTLASIKAEVEMLLDVINASMSTYIENSELSRFNQSRSLEWQVISPALAVVLAQAQHISELSGGAFDVTVGPLVNLWGFGPSSVSERQPTQQEIVAAHGRVGYRQLEFSFELLSVRKKIPDLYLDLSAIAKGYAVDQIAQLLVEKGINDFLVEIGGELRAKGVNSSKEIWRIGVEKPDEQYIAERIIYLNNAAIATSGDYKNYREIDGQRYSHEINPLTGRPITHRTSSVSVIANNAMEADAWATALLILGSEAGMKLAREHNIAAYFIDRKTGDETGFFSIWSDAFEPYFSVH